MNAAKRKRQVCLIFPKNSFFSPNHRKFSSLRVILVCGENWNNVTNAKLHSLWLHHFWDSSRGFFVHLHGNHDTTANFYPIFSRLTEWVSGEVLVWAWQCLNRCMSGWLYVNEFIGLSLCKDWWNLNWVNRTCSELRHLGNFHYLLFDIYLVDHRMSNVRIQGQ